MLSKTLPSSIGKIYKDYNIRGGDTQRFEEMWLDRVRDYPGVDAAQPRQQSNIQWRKRVRVAGNMGKKKSISPMKSYRGRATIPREKQWLPRSKWACICTVEVKWKRDLLRLLPFILALNHLQLQKDSTFSFTLKSFTFLFIWSSQLPVVKLLD